MLSRLRGTSFSSIVTALRMIVAVPLVAVWIGADVCGDKEMTDKLDRWIDRIVGGTSP